MLLILGRTNNVHLLDYDMVLIFDLFDHIIEQADNNNAEQINEQMTIDSENLSGVF